MSKASKFKRKRRTAKSNSIGRLIGAYDGLPIVGKGGLTGTNTTAMEIVDRIMREAARK